MNARILLKISRPRFWLYTAGPILVGAAFAGPASLSWLMLALFAWFLVPGNIFLYGVNDLADRDTDRYNAKKGDKEHRHDRNEARALRVAILISLALFVPIAILSLWHALVFFSLFFVLGAGYSLEPLRFKAHPFVDAASNALYAMPGLGAYALASGQLPSAAAMIAAFSWSAAMQWLSAIPDVEADRKAGLRTSAIVFGTRASLVSTALLWLVSIVSAVIAGLPLWLAAIGFAYVIIPLALLGASQGAIERAYWRYPWINAAIGMLLFFAGVAHAF